MEQKLNLIFSSVFNLKEGDAKAHLKIGDIPNWDSMGQLNLITAIEEELGIYFSTDEIVEMNSYEKISELLCTQKFK